MKNTFNSPVFRVLPNGEFIGFPIEIIEKMIDAKVTWDNSANVSIFDNLSKWLEGQVKACQELGGMDREIWAFNRVIKQLKEDMK